MLEETLRIAHAMFEGERGSEGAFSGRHYRAERLLNSPQSLSRPGIPIMVGGGGEKKTLRLVAQYADACNVFGAPEAIARKYAILADHCAAVGRDPDEIERSTLQNVRVGPDRAPGTESPARIVDRFGDLADAGAQHVIVGVRDLADPGPSRSSAAMSSRTFATSESSGVRTPRRRRRKPSRIPPWSMPRVIG